MNSNYDPEADAFYFSPKSMDGHKIIKTVPLGLREVRLDVDMDGNIVGVEVL